MEQTTDSDASAQQSSPVTVNPTDSQTDRDTAEDNVLQAYQQLLEQYQHQSRHNEQLHSVLSLQSSSSSRSSPHPRDSLFQAVLTENQVLLQRYEEYYERCKVQSRIIRRLLLNQQMQEGQKQRATQITEKPSSVAELEDINQPALLHPHPPQESASSLLAGPPLIHVSAQTLSQNISRLLAQPPLPYNKAASQYSSAHSTAEETEEKKQEDEQRDSVISSLPIVTKHPTQRQKLPTTRTTSHSLSSTDSRKNQGNRVKPQIHTTDKLIHHTQTRPASSSSSSLSSSYMSTQTPSSPASGSSVNAPQSPATPTTVLSAKRIRGSPALSPAPVPKSPVRARASTTDTNNTSSRLLAATASSTFRTRSPPERSTRSPSPSMSAVPALKLYPAAEKKVLKQKNTNGKLSSTTEIAAK